MFGHQTHRVFGLGCLWMLIVCVAHAERNPSEPATPPAETAPADGARREKQPAVTVLNEGEPLVEPAIMSRSAYHRQFYRSDEFGIRFFFAPMDSQFRRVQLQREAERGTGGSLAAPVQANAPAVDPRKRAEILRTYDAIMLKGIRHFRDREYERAARQFRLGHVAIKRDVSSRIYLAVAFYAMWEYPEALAVLREAYELYPGLWQLPFDLRMEYVKQHEYEKHLDRLRRRVVASPPNTDLKILLGAMYHFSDMDEQADPHLVKAARRYKDDAMLAALMSAVQNRTGQESELQAACEPAAPVADTQAR